MMTQETDLIQYLYGIKSMVYKSPKSFQLNLYNSFILIQQFLLFFHRQLPFPERTRDAHAKKPVQNRLYLSNLNGLFRQA